MKTSTAAALLALTLLAPATASAGLLDSGFRTGFKGIFGFGGEYESDFKGGGKADSDAEPSAGFALNLEYPWFRYFSVAFEAGFLWGRSEAAEDANIDRSLGVLLTPVLKGRYTFMGGRAEIGVSVPVGLAIVVPSDDQEGVDTGVGWTAGFLVGGAYNVFSRLAATLELGWRGVGTSHDLDGGGEVDVSGHQFALNVGITWVW